MTIFVHGEPYIKSQKQLPGGVLWKRCSLKFRITRTCARVSFLIKLQVQAKETPTQTFSCEFGEISKNAFFTEHLWWLLLNAVSKRHTMIYLSSLFKSPFLFLHQIACLIDVFLLVHELNRLISRCLLLSKYLPV